MSKILVLNTGGTFNKVYNEITGELEVLDNCNMIKEIIEKSYKGNLDITIKGIVFKDSIFMDNDDRELIAKNLKGYKKIVIVHGTDTIDMTSIFLEELKKDKLIVLTGAMKPFSIEKIEATANLIQAITFVNNYDKKGVFISMHGLIEKQENIQKDRDLGIFSVKD